MPTCNRCGGRIIFIKSREGRKRVCEPGITWIRSGYPELRALTSAGDLLIGSECGREEEGTEAGHLFHADVCPRREEKQGKSSRPVNGQSRDTAGASGGAPPRIF